MSHRAGFDAISASVFRKFLGNRDLRFLLRDVVCFGWDLILQQFLWRDLMLRTSKTIKLKSNQVGIISSRPANEATNEIC